MYLCIFGHVRPAKTSASTQSDQSIVGAQWMAKKPKDFSVVFFFSDGQHTGSDQAVDKQIGLSLCCVRG